MSLCFGYSSLVGLGSLRTARQRILRKAARNRTFTQGSVPAWTRHTSGAAKSQCRSHQFQKTSLTTKLAPRNSSDIAARAQAISRHLSTSSSDSSYNRMNQWVFPPPPHAVAPARRWHSMAPTPILLAPERARASGITLADHESAFRENSATIVMPSAEAAFLNPVQEFNRDLSTLAIRTWSERLDDSLCKSKVAVLPLRYAG